jgi:hypothetical protein
MEILRRYVIRALPPIPSQLESASGDIAIGDPDPGGFFNFGRLINVLQGVVL